MNTKIYPFTPVNLLRGETQPPSLFARLMNALRDFFAATRDPHWSGEEAMAIKQPDTMPTEVTKKPVNEAIADEVRKDQGMTPTFPFGARDFEEKSAAEDEDEEIREAREKAEIERVPGGGPQR